MLQNTIFVVNEEPYCIWEVDLPGRNKEFLNGIDTDYFDYLVKVHVESNDEKRAGIALRSTLHHAMETLFSLLGAYIQAPDCTYAWIAKCKNSELRDLVSKIDRSNRPLFTKLNIDKVSWEAVAKCIFHRYMPQTQKNEEMTRLSAMLWRRLGHEFTDQIHIDEYNSLKHGFRVRSGGFSLGVGIEHEYGVPPPPEEMKMIGGSEFGTSFFNIEAVGKVKRNRSIRSRRTSINWKIEKIILLIQLISMSITNVVSALKIANGVDPSTCKFNRPSKDSDFETPWQYSPAVTSFNIDFIIDEKEVIPTTKEELLEKIKYTSKVRGKQPI